MDFFDLTPGGLPGDAAAPDDSAAVFDRNIRAIARLAPRTAELLRGATARPDVTFIDTPQRVPSASIEEQTEDAAEPTFTEDDPLGLNVPAPATKARWLASRRRPLAESRRLAETVDAEGNGAACVLGIGLGYQCRALAERWGDLGVVVCFEPDVGLLRAVLERVDHSEWIEKSHVVILTDPEDGPSLTKSLQGVEAVVTLGATIVEHPASVQRLGAAGQRFAGRFADVLRATRTNIVTTLVQSEVTLRNMLMNIDRYATGRGVADLTGTATGKPAIVVSAGPSLSRNIDLLSEPGVRDRFVIVATQTTLKPLLRAGVKPHFVTALDYHEISRRFYEGLTAEDVEGITLIAESKANPAILDAYPGEVRCPAEERLDLLLGPEFASSPGSLKPGSTVAHLAYYVARHLGCDPVILIGQDLGFTDGQYYAAGAAIHDVWAGELGPFRSLEQFEWERIVREKSLLHRRTDVFGRPVYSDEQMTTYLQQFEVEFAADTALGRRIVDATEGGVAKKHTTPMTLAEALKRFSGDPVRLPSHTGTLHDPETRLPLAAERIRKVRADARTVAQLSRDTKALLERMLKSHLDQSRVNELIEKVYANRDRVETLEPAYGLTQFLNQTGTLNRYRADRAITLADRADEGGLTELDRQRHQIERDIRNVDWLAMAADVLEGLLGDAVAVLEGRRSKILTNEHQRTEERADPSIDVAQARRLGVVLMGDLDAGGLDTPRDLADTIAMINGAPRNALQLTLDRLNRTESPTEIIVATPDPDRARAIAGDAGVGVVFERVDADRLAGRRASIAAARIWSPDSWRGGLASLSCYDESLDLRELDSIMDRRGLTDVAIVGLDWSLVDPTMIDAMAEVSAGRQDGKRLAICQAPPGLGSMLLDRASVASLARATDNAGAFASLGGIISYIPVTPVADPIGKSLCVPVPHAVRDLGRRVVADTPEGRALVRTAIEAEGADWATTTLDRIADVITGQDVEPQSPRHLTLELCTGRLASGLWARWNRGGADVERRPIDLALALRTIEQLAGARPDAALTLHGLGDPLMHPACLEIVAAAKSAGVRGVHLRTDLLRDDIDLEALARCGADAISIDVLSINPTTYEALTGHDLYERTKTRVETLLSHRTTNAGGLPTPWIVPRITRCDEVYAEIEAFYDGWMMAAGSVMLDPPPYTETDRTTGDQDTSRRIRALPVPPSARGRFDRDGVTVCSDGRLNGTDVDVRTTPLDEAWRRLRRKLAKPTSEIQSFPLATETIA
ncbi:MAG: 6-hydroxymethylpterin diphosphokinase MptE-like protein [Planctomycetota bacterium]